jgi:hypothetical protein
VAQEISQPLITEVILPGFCSDFVTRVGAQRACEDYLERARCPRGAREDLLASSLTSGTVSKAVPLPVFEQELATEFFYRDNFHCAIFQRTRVE